MPTPINLTLLEIPTPCPADWAAMKGDDATRFCKHCSLHVYNLSAMTAARAERVVADHAGGRMCVRMFKRADGTVVTDDCRGGWRKSFRRATSLAATGAATVLAIFGATASWADPSTVAMGVPGTTTSTALMGGAMAPTTEPTMPTPVVGGIRVQPTTQPLDRK